jgi:hypothetical protein
MNETIDVRAVRGILAEARVTHTVYARACGLNRIYVGQILSGRVYPGELARIKLERGLVALGLTLERQAKCA